MPSRTSFKLLDALLARARALTREHGEQGKLAKYLGISPARMSEFLKESPKKRRPDGETALRLRLWVTERDQFIKQQPDGADD